MSARARARYEITAEDKSRRAFTSFGASIRGTVKMMGGLRTAIAGVVGAGSLGLLVKQSLDAGDSIQKTAIRLGASTEALSQLRHVASLTGVEFRTLTMAFQRMTRRVAEAAVGTGEARGALAELGLDARALAALAPEDQFLAIASAMEKVKTDGDRVRLAMKLFDSEGVALVQTMAGGAESIRAMMAEADQLGLTLTRVEADSMAAANDAITRMQGSVKGLANEMAVTFAPAIVVIADLMKDLIPGAVKVAVGAFNMLRIAAGVALLGLAKIAQSVFGLLGKLPGKLGAQFRGMAASAGMAAESILSTTTGIADQLLGAGGAGRLSASAPAAAAASPTLSPLAATAAPDIKALQAFVKRMESGSEKIGIGRQIDLNREALTGVGAKKSTVVEGPILSQIATLLQAIKDEQRRGALITA